MAMDFPGPPLTVGQLYPPTPVAGLPQYKWDGTVWVAVLATEMQNYVKRVGDTMTGALTLFGDPTAVLHAATKQYVDGGVGGVGGGLAGKVDKAGDTMTGLLTLSGAPTATLHAATKQYVDGRTGSSINSVAVQKFTSSGTYTPTAGMKYCIIECIGGGGGGGGVTGTAGQFYAAAGGGSGGYSRKTATAAQIGVSQVITVGGGGNGGAVSGTGSSGGATSAGSLCVANGGAGGIGASSGIWPSSGGDGGGPGTGDIAAAGAPGESGMYSQNFTIKVITGMGGSSVFGGGGRSAPSNANAAGGISASNYGSGGGGAAADNIASSNTGGNGSAGLVIITEFI